MQQAIIVSRKSTCKYTEFLAILPLFPRIKSYMASFKVISTPITSMIVKQPQRNSIYLAIHKKSITFVIAMHFGQAMTVMVLFLII